MIAMMLPSHIISGPSTSSYCPDPIAEASKKPMLWQTHAMAYSSTKTGVNGNFVLCKHIECNGLFGLLKDFCSEKTFFVDA